MFKTTFEAHKALVAVRFGCIPVMGVSGIHAYVVEAFEASQNGWRVGLLDCSILNPSESDPRRNWPSF